MKKSLLLLLLFVILLMSGCSNSTIKYDTFLTEDFLSQENQEGHIFSANKYYEEVGRGESRDILINTNSKRFHLIEWVFIASGGPQDIIIYENVSYSDTGDEINITTRNRELDSLINSTAELYEEPTITDNGTEIGRDIIAEGRKEAGRTMVVPYHMILKANTSYLIRTKNRVGDEEQIVKLVWWEKRVK
ncbi:MAG: hypothetical protein ACOC56_01290 [Atribacterota bacterium]